MLPEQKAYIYAWVDGVTAAGFRAGIYCSGIPSQDDGNVVTAEDIRADAGEGARATREIVYWAINDACPPAPGCAFPTAPPSPAESGVSFAEVWQFAQSPQRKDVAAHCSNYSRDRRMLSAGNFPRAATSCGLGHGHQPDPSNGRTQLIAAQPPPSCPPSKARCSNLLDCNDCLKKIHAGDLHFMSRTLSILAIVALILTLSAAAQDTWQIRSRRTPRRSFLFVIWEFPLFVVRFTKVSGTVQYDAANLGKSSIQTTIDATSVDTRVEMRDNDLRSPRFLDAEKYPTITFASRRKSKLPELAS
jgi:hypothetical protein